MGSISQLKSRIDSASAWFVIISASGLLVYWTVIGTKKVEAISLVVQDSRAQSQIILKQ